MEAAVQTPGAACERIDTPDLGASTQWRVPSISAIDERDAFRVFSVLADQGVPVCELRVQIVFAARVSNGGEDLLYFSLFNANGTVTLHRGVARMGAGGCEETSLVTGRILGLTQAEISRIASGEADIPEYGPLPWGRGENE